MARRYGPPVGEGRHDDKTEEVHVNILHPFIKLRGQIIPLEYTKEMESRHREHSKYPDYVPKDILDHRINEETGRLEFRTQWEGFTKDWITWEPVTSFIGDVTKKWSNHCRDLASTWTGMAMGT